MTMILTNLTLFQVTADICTHLTEGKPILIQQMAWYHQAPEPMLTKIYDIKLHHNAKMS